MLIIGHDGDRLEVYNPWGITSWITVDQFVNGHVGGHAGARRETAGCATERRRRAAPPAVMSSRGDTAADSTTAPTTKHPRQQRFPRRLDAIVVVLLLIFVVVVLSVRYRHVHSPSGTIATTTPTPMQCRLDPGVLAQTRTHNFERLTDQSAAHLPEGGGLNLSCSWGQVRGEDGIDPHHLEFRVQRFDIPRTGGTAREQFDRQAQTPYATGRRTDTAVPGLGDGATFAVTTDRNDLSLMRLAVWQGNLLVNVYVRGEQRYLFWITQMSTEEAR
ncbi:hypothetical protein [Nocardia nova]|uniref:hypothetical protein n=1 Tax=Nocardia nova TaxID=37330 RepID=UPI001895600A|nr:hypothetical protein [Nocardia nova]MBF6148058.1 hypothetical protein [Nocardia nova]